MSEVELRAIVRSVQRGVGWLREHADALTDARDLAVTTSALIAAERNPHSNLVQKLVAGIARRQSTNGSWNDELWDTTWAAKALHDAGCRSNAPPMQAALRFFEATQDPHSRTWYEEPFETMLVLDIIARVDSKRLSTLGSEALQWITSLQRPDGCLIGIRYTGMAASLLCLVQKAGISVPREILLRAINYIRGELAARSIWTAASWSNYYPLKGLLDSGVPDTDLLVRKAVAWFLGAQDTDGKWMQVSRVHDTAMAVLVLSEFLSTPLIDVAEPRTGVLSAVRENGTMRVSFHGPGAGAITPAEKLKISDQVRAELSSNQQLMVAALGRARGTTPAVTPRRKLREASILLELERAGKYAYGHLIPARIQLLLENSPADHLRLEIDERLIDLPWELIHDGTDFLCLRYAVGRHLLSDQEFQPPHHPPRTVQQTRVLVVADPTQDLPAARAEGCAIASLLRNACGMAVDESIESAMTKKEFLLSLGTYDIVHYAGHASHDPTSPDESYLAFPDGKIRAFEIGRFLASRSPALVFLNACWSAEELRDAKSYSPMMRGLGRTFLYAGVTAFLGYLVPVPDQSATRFALSFYEALSQAQTIGESLRRARIASLDPMKGSDLTWSSAVLYGDPAARAVGIPDVTS